MEFRAAGAVKYELRPVQVLSELDEVTVRVAQVGRPLSPEAIRRWHDRRGAARDYFIKGGIRVAPVSSCV